MVAALKAGNSISPSGNARIKDQMPIVPVNSMVHALEDLGGIPLRLGENIYLRDVAQIKDGTDIPMGHTLVNGRRAVFMLVTKRADASTLSVVNEVKAVLRDIKDVLPEDVEISYEFDQSPYVERAIAGVCREGALGAALTGLMVFLFLRDWRTVVVVVLNIPFALLAAVLALWLCGQTINLMTLGGLALAVGILVDVSTVEVENIHSHLPRSPSVARAARSSNRETAVEGAQSRLRPVLMTSFAMLAGMVPMAFALAEGEEQSAPLGQAVIGGVIAATLATLVILPSIFAVLQRRAATASPSLDPDDAASRFFDDAGGAA